jgi:four helix bundle protein
MGFKFEKLVVWQEAMNLGEEMYVLTRKYPKEELFNLTSQTMRAVDSIGLNISEGAMGQTDPENRKFIGYSIRSCAEVISCLYKASSRKYITKEEFDTCYYKIEVLFKRLNKYRSSLD